MIRCPLCLSYFFRPLFRREFWVCRLCSLGARSLKDFATEKSLPNLARYQDIEGFTFPSWTNPLTRYLGRVPRDQQHHRLFFSLPSVHTFAYRRRKLISGYKSALISIPLTMPWSFSSTIAVELEDVTSFDNSWLRERLALGIISRLEDVASVIAICTEHSVLFGEIVILFDSSRPLPVEEAARKISRELGPWASCPSHRLVVSCHPLDQDFASQRNRVRMQATKPWILQLDTDEILSIEARWMLGSLIYEAERHGFDVIGLSRRNIVDGVVSAMYPDVAYRITRCHIPWVRPVHEYPIVRNHRRVIACIGADIIHSINSERLVKRSAFYESIASGSGRTSEMHLLTTPIERGLITET